MKLYEITGAMKEVQQMLEDGVPVEQLQDTLDEIELDFKEKAESCLYALANLNAEAEGCKAEIARLTERKKIKENQAKKLKDYLLFNMQDLGFKKVDNGVMTASVRKGVQKLQINNEDAIPQEFKKINTSVSIDKALLLKSLKELEEGKTIEGAEVIQGEHTLTIK